MDDHAYIAPNPHRGDERADGRNEADLRGLVLVYKNGTEWKWSGHCTSAKGLRLATWASPCRHCGAAFTVATILPAAHLRRRFLELRARALATINQVPDPAARRTALARLEIRIPVPVGRRVSGFETRNCKQHHHSRYDRIEALV